MILIDTNVLLYATVGGFAEHPRARAFLDAAISGDVQHCICWVSVFEYLRAVTHPKLLRPAPLPLDKALENEQPFRGREEAEATLARIAAG